MHQRYKSKFGLHSIRPAVEAPILNKTIDLEESCNDEPYPEGERPLPNLKLMFGQKKGLEYFEQVTSTGCASPTINTKLAREDLDGMFSQPIEHNNNNDTTQSFYYAPEDDETISKQVYVPTAEKMHVFNDNEDNVRRSRVVLGIDKTPAPQSRNRPSQWTGKIFTTNTMVILM